MDPAVPAMIAAIASVIGVGVTAWNAVRVERVKAELSRQAVREERETQAKEVLDRFRQPLVDSAFDLQSRLYNILELGFLNYVREGSDRRDAALRTSIFRFAQYFAWIERLRNDIQLLAFPEDEQTQRVSELIAEVRKTLNSDRLDDGRLMLWRDEQRALGELLIDRADGTVLVLGYAAFTSKYDEVFASWTKRFENELADEASAKSERLTQVQHALCEVVHALDPDEQQYARTDLLLAGGEAGARRVEIGRLNTLTRLGEGD